MVKKGQLNNSLRLYLHLPNHHAGRKEVAAPLVTGEVNRPNLFPLIKMVAGKANRLNLPQQKEVAEGLIWNNECEEPTEIKEIIPKGQMIGPILTSEEWSDSLGPTKLELAD